MSFALPSNQQVDHQAVDSLPSKSSLGSQEWRGRMVVVLAVAGAVAIGLGLSLVPYVIVAMGVGVLVFGVIANLIAKRRASRYQLPTRQLFSERPSQSSPRPAHESIRESSATPPYKSVKQGAERSTYCFSDGTIFYGLKRSLLGKGGTAHVKVAEDEKGGRWARRICELKTPEAIQAFEKTVALHERLKGCRQIMPCTHSLKYCGGSNKEKAVMIHPLVPKSLIKLILYKQINNTNKYSLARQLLQGLKAIYDLDQGGAHGDIKPENILIDLRENLYIIDLEYYRSPQEKGLLTRGTLNWMVPEFFDQRSDLLQEDLIDTKKLDSWSAGLLLYYIFNNQDVLTFPWFNVEGGRKPFPSEVNERLRLGQQKGHLSDQEAFLLSNMLQVDPKLRWTIPEALSYFQEEILKVPVVG